MYDIFDLILGTYSYSITPIVRLSNKHNSFHYREKQRRRMSRRKDVFITASLILPVSLKVYNCLEGAEMD